MKSERSDSFRGAQQMVMHRDNVSPQLLHKTNKVAERS